MTKKQAKQFSEIMTDWLLRAVTIQFKNEDDEYQQMADYFNSRIIIDEEKLEELAEKYVINWYKTNNIPMEQFEIDKKISKEDFKAGYRKAMED